MQTLYILNEHSQTVVVGCRTHHALLDVVVDEIIDVNIVVCQPISTQLSSGFRVGFGLTTCLLTVHVRVTMMSCI